jgi:hypothetical protein
MDDDGGGQTGAGRVVRNAAAAAGSAGRGGTFGTVPAGTLFSFCGFSFWNAEAGDVFASAFALAPIAAVTTSAVPTATSRTGQVHRRRGTGMDLDMTVLPR